MSARPAGPADAGGADAPGPRGHRGEAARPPLGSWRALYLLVAASLLADIALLAAFTRAFR